MCPLAIFCENRYSKSALATASAYKILAFDPTTSLFSSAFLIQFRLSLYCKAISFGAFSNSSAIVSSAILSVL